MPRQRVSLKKLQKIPHFISSFLRNLCTQKFVDQKIKNSFTSFLYSSYPCNPFLLCTTPYPLHSYVGQKGSLSSSVLLHERVFVLRICCIVESWKQNKNREHEKHRRKSYRSGDIQNHEAKTNLLIFSFALEMNVNGLARTLSV